MATGKALIPLILGGIASAAAAAVLYRVPVLGPRHFLTGAAGGLFVAYLAFLLYFLLLPRPGGNKMSFVRSYLPGAVARYAVLIGAFCALVFWLNMDALGVLIGAFAGMMAATFVSLVTMRRAATRTPGA